MLHKRFRRQLKGVTRHRLFPICDLRTNVALRHYLFHVSLSSISGSRGFGVSPFRPFPISDPQSDAAYVCPRQLLILAAKFLQTVRVPPDYDRLRLHITRSIQIDAEPNQGLVGATSIRRAPQGINRPSCKGAIEANRKLIFRKKTDYILLFCTNFQLGYRVAFECIHSCLISSPALLAGR
jgi:hypothetical protein